MAYEYGTTQPRRGQMTLEQYGNLQPETIIKYGEERYKLLVKDSFGKWVAEVIDPLDNVTGFRKLKYKDSIVEYLQVIE
jgi:hypothetical protein